MKSQHEPSAAATAHTPTPWTMDGERRQVTGPDGILVCTLPDVFSGNFNTRILANARLIAAAPELLDAVAFLVENAVVQACVLQHNTPNAASLPDLKKAIAIGRAAIAKAEGRL